MSQTDRVLVVTGDAGESYEALYATHRLREAGVDVVVAAPSRRRLHLVIHDFEPGWDTYIERQGYGLESDVTFTEASVEGYAAVLVLGGRAPEYLRHDAALLALVREFATHDRWIFAICHGIQVLIAAGLVAGRRVTCYEHVRNEVELAGGTYCTEQAVRDGKIVTAQTWQSHPEFYREVIRCLGEAAATQS
jgi:protease I